MDSMGLVLQQYNQESALGRSHVHPPVAIAFAFIDLLHTENQNRPLGSLPSSSVKNGRLFLRFFPSCTKTGRVNMDHITL